MKKVLLGVSASISAYKAADITSSLIKKGVDVEIAMTKHATKFITPLTLQSLNHHPIHVEVIEEMEPEIITHVDLARNADLFLVAPASADILGKMANGIADDMLSSLNLAIHPETPKLFAPAMNTYMYDNPITQKNINQLKTFGYEEIAPKTARLACGDVGRGALANVEDIVQAVLAHLEK